MSVSGGDILLKGEVKARLRYRSDSSFYEFLKDERNGFPMPFKVGGRNCWYEDEVDAWISKQSEKRGICTS
ncbi:helix-turn-helix transcriptional regulator [Serratia liquefaciens]|uniref:helix-turn-helix transcriptional regulator n=1 Tax=Serratia liquefaciens TaxID=614 RepID=UPI003905E8A5